MNFLKNNWEVLILVILTIMSEVFHLLFVNVPFYREGYNLDTPIYYLVSQFGLLTFVPSIIIFWLIPKSKTASSLIAFGLILWNITEMGDEISYITGNGLEVFETNWGQFSMLCMIVFWGWLGYMKWKS